jgi:photosystem II stability/assembly factor-like uncharacterized protein
MKRAARLQIKQGNDRSNVFPRWFAEPAGGHASRPGKTRCFGIREFSAIAVAILLILGVSPLNAADECHEGCVSQAQIEGPAQLAGAMKAVGWAVGGVSTDGYGTILHTTNGGQTWVRQGIQDAIADLPLNGVAAVDAREAWVVGGSLILHTRDGGQTWCREANDTSLTGTELLAVSAVDIYTAWAVGGDGVIVRTTNGGCTWERQGAGQIPAVPLNGVYASDASHVWIVGTEENGNEYGTILRTTDGGETWTKVPYKITHTPAPTDYYLITVDGANANEVWAVGHDQIMHISVTRKGVTVSDQTPAFSNYMDINGVFALTSRSIWAVADASNIWRSDNGGKTWTLRNKGQYDHGYILRVSAVDGQHAWATVASQTTGPGQVISTSNGGKSWAAQTIPAQPVGGMWGISFVK